MTDDRRYRQRGYRDDGGGGDERRPGGERGRERPGKPQGPKPFGFDPEKGPRGRGLGAPTETVFKCAACGTAQGSVDVAAGARCVRCGEALRTCTSCAHFESSIRNECRQGGATLPDGRAGVKVSKKSAETECVLWQPRLAAGFAREAPRNGGGGTGGGENGAKRGNAADPRAAFDALFKL